MAVKILAAVFDGFPGGGSELLAMLALADWSDDLGRCYPGMPSIARKVRLSEKQARRVVHGLIEGGFVVVTAGKVGGGMSRRYQINMDRLTPPAHGRAPTTGRPPAHVPDPSRPWEATPPAHGSRTVIEPSVNRQLLSAAPKTAQAKPRKTPGAVAPAGSDAADACPHQAIKDLYRQHLPAFPQPRVWEGNRANNLRARWRWVLTAKKANGDSYATTEAEAMDFFARFFGYVAQSDFLTGKDGKWTGCDLPWLVKAENFAKVLEGKYENRGDAA